MEKLIDKLKSLGARITKTRCAVLEYLSVAIKPVSALDILNELKRRKILVNRTTVYREISFLLEQSLIRELKIIGQASLFELADKHCHHLICLKCHDVKTIPMDNHLHEEEVKIMKKEKFKISDHTLEFYGLCHKCQ